MSSASGACSIVSSNCCRMGDMGGPPMALTNNVKANIIPALALGVLPA